MSSDGGVWVKIGGNEDTTPPAIVSGGTVTTYVDSGITYQVNTFTSTNVLNVSQSGKMDLFLVGAGASGGPYYGGGGGAGQVIEASGIIQKGSYAATVGLGGAPTQAQTVPGGNDGTYTAIFDFIAVGGGAGGSRTGGVNQGGFAGASGGGGSDSHPTYTDGFAGSGIPGIGFDGGVGNVANIGGGGGGAGSKGADAVSGVSSDGGDGLPNSLQTNVVQFYAGGGGGGGASGGQYGGAGGSGVGGNGNSVGGGNGFDAVANTGSGGGAGGTNVSGFSGAGADGIIVVRTITSNSRPGTVVASGGTETTFTGDGSNGDLGQDYKVHTFTSDGTLSVSVAGEVDALVVGGGGSGGSGYGGGGGAGGHLYITNAYLSAATHNVIVGAGGVGNPIKGQDAAITGSNGNASSVADYFSPGGGAGAAKAMNNPATIYYSSPGLAGGSGGGASGMLSGSGDVGGSGTAGLGNAGGNATTGILYAAAGGGGAGSVGVTPTSNNIGGNGGAGLSSSITGFAVVRAGGAGGSGSTTAGTGGTGGGGAGSLTTPGTAGTANTGSAGGGCHALTPASVGGAGGSGIVIVRYKI